MRGSELPVASLGLRPGTYSVSDGRDEKQKNPGSIWFGGGIVLLLIVTMEMNGPCIICWRRLQPTCGPF
ncbi:hypothetical protein V8C26DRAFT_397788 [Trichoderma gracile]